MKKIASRKDSLNEIPREIYTTNGLWSAQVKCAKFIVIKYTAYRQSLKILPWFCIVHIYGLILRHKGKKTVYLQSFLGLSDPVDLLVIFFGTVLILQAIGKSILTKNGVFIIAAILTVCIAGITIITTLLFKSCVEDREEIQQILIDIVS